MTTTQITTVDLDISALAGEFADEFDWPAIRRAYAEALAAASGVPTLVIATNGDVYVDVEHADAARAVDWRELDERIDGEAILDAHPLKELPR